MYGHRSHNVKKVQKRARCLKAGIRADIVTAWLASFAKKKVITRADMVQGW